MTIQHLPTEAAARAAYPDAQPHLLDGPGSKAKFMTAVAEALSFPEWFGRNLDALADCVGDLSWLPAGAHLLIWRNPDALLGGDARTYHQVEEILTEADGRQLGAVHLHVVTVAE